MSDITKFLGTVPPFQVVAADEGVGPLNPQIVHPRIIQVHFVFVQVDLEVF